MCDKSLWEEAKSSSKYSIQREDRRVWADKNHPRHMLVHASDIKRSRIGASIASTSATTLEDSEPRYIESNIWRARWKPLRAAIQRMFDESETERIVRELNDEGSKRETLRDEEGKKPGMSNLPEYQNEGKATSRNMRDPHANSVTEYSNRSTSNSDIPTTSHPHVRFRQTQDSDHLDTWYKGIADEEGIGKSGKDGGKHVQTSWLPQSYLLLPMHFRG